MTWRSSEDAVAFERSRATSGFQLPVGDCLGATRDAYGSPGTGGTAAIAFAATKSRHGVYDTPPLGALVWFTGGSTGAGHVGISNGEGYFWNTDFGPNGYIGDGRIRLILISAINQHDPQLKYVGWTSDLDGVEVLGMTDAQMQELKAYIRSVALDATLYLVSGIIDGTIIPNTPTWDGRKTFNLQAIATKVNQAPAASSGVAPSPADIANELAKRLSS